MMDINRRNFLKLGAATAAVLALGRGRALINAMELADDKDYNPQTGAERKRIPTTCWQCVTRCPAVGYVDNGRVVKMDGNPESIRSEGKMCAKGQGGVNQVYDPDRILYPMKRVGARGEGKWKRVSWDEALTELAARLKKLRDDGHPEKFMFHYGRMKASSSKLIKSGFLGAYGTGTVGNHTAICEGGKWSSQELTWGGHYDNWDFDNTQFVLNFGSNCLEAHTNHIPVAHRLIRAMADRKVRMVTFDVRLSNTAARSDEWVPIKPGGDCAVILAMCNVVLENDLYKGAGEEFLKFCKCTKDPTATVEEKVAALKSHFAKYTPEWAEGESDVPAEKIRSLAIEFATTKPACLVSYRGAVAHYNGNEAERACQTLASITGNIDNPGGRCKAVGAGWKYPKVKDLPKSKKLNIGDGPTSGPLKPAYPTHHVCQYVLKMIKDGSEGRPDVYFWYCYTPVYANGEMQENIDIMKDESLMPYTACSNTSYDESAALADLILPDATYLERWDWEDMVSPAQIPDYAIRQPLIQPLGEARNFADVCCELADRMGFPLGFSSMEEFVKKSCEETPDVADAGGFEYMKKHGAYHVPGAKPKYYSYKKVVLDVAMEPVESEGKVYADLEEPVEVAPHFGDDVLFDEEDHVYWHWKKSKAKDVDEAKEKGYRHTKNAYKGYVGTKIGDVVYGGFKPDKVNKSGYMELYSNLLEDKGYPPLPTYMKAPEHKNMGANDLILTTYKISVQIHSRSQNCKWLSEISHTNPALINPRSAGGIKTGDKIRVKSAIGTITTKAFVTEGIIPGAIAIAHHHGHWEYGRYASGKKAPDAGKAPDSNDPDINLKWWSEYGVRPNWIIPNAMDPINGQMTWMDTVVTVSKA